MPRLSPRDPLLVLASLTAYYLAAGPSHLHWYLPTGLVFAACWLLPRRDWAAIAIGAIAARVLRGALHGGWDGSLEFMLGNFPQPLLTVLGVWLLLRWKGRPDGIDSLQAMSQLIAVAALTAVAIMLANLGFMTIHPTWQPSLQFAMTVLLGDFLGVVILTPAAVWLCTAHHRAGSSRILREVLVVLLPFVAVFVLLVRWHDGTLVGEMLRLLLLAALILSAVRHGWRGAALTVLLISVAVALERPLDAFTDSTIWMQLFVAVAGAMALLLGASVDSLRRHAQMLEERQRALEHAHGLQHALIQEVRLASERQLRAEERARREIARELHDEVGQTLTALQTHVKLIEPVFLQAGRLDLSTRIADLARSMRNTLGGLLEALHPAALDELGLYGALDRGPIRAMMEDAGIEFTVELVGEARLLEQLDEVMRVAIYRVVQEAATNVVRHARAGRCRVRLRLGRRSGQLWLFLDVRDDGRGFPVPLRRGQGLQGMQDRFRTLGGHLRLSSGGSGMRLHGLLRQPLGAEPDGYQP